MDISMWLPDWGVVGHHGGMKETCLPIPGQVTLIP